MTQTAVAAAPGGATDVAEATLIGRLRAVPGLTQLLALVGVALAVAIGITAFMWFFSKPGMVTLYSGLAEQDAAEVVEALKTAQVTYEADAVAGTIMVPADKVHEMRLSLAAQGLPRGSSAGFEMMREDQGLGVSQFMENARYQHALEIELSRTVSSLQPVKSARVHLAIPKRSAFARAQGGASASVAATLYPGRRLESGQVAAIVHLVSSSIPDMDASKVTVIDQAGRLLSQSDEIGEMGVTSTQYEHMRRLENHYLRRIEELLTPITGLDRISAQVSVDLDYTATEETREVYDPRNNTMIRSEVIVRENRAEDGVEGIPGAVANRPPEEGEAEAEAGRDNLEDPALRSHQATRNFELDRTVSHTKQAPGQVRRISAAVLVDYLPKPSPDDPATLTPQALTAEELQKINNLVREAIGFSVDRGDTISIENVQFVSQVVPDLEPPPIWEQPVFRDITRQLLGTIALLAFAFVILRPVLRAALQPSRALSRVPPGALPQGAGGPQTDAQLSASGAPNEAPERQRPNFDKKLDTVRSVVAEDPKKVAQLVKEWVGNE